MSGVLEVTDVTMEFGGLTAVNGVSIRVDPGEYSPWLGDSYQNLASMGLAFQRSQNSGR